METRIVTLPVPCSDNARLIIHRVQRRMILSPKARAFLEEGGFLLKHQWPRDMILVPTNSHQLHISVKAFVPNWRGDCSNFTKLLKDVLTGTVYDDDKFVHLNYEDTEKDPKKPRIILTIPIDPYTTIYAKNHKEREGVSSPH